MLCGVGDQLMEHHCHRLACLRLQYDVGTIDGGVGSRRIGCQLTSHKFQQRYSLPPTLPQEFVRPRHRANAAIKRTTKWCIELLASNVWAATALTVASTF